MTAPETQAGLAVTRALERAVERESWPRKGKLYVSDLKHAVPLDEGGGCRRELKGKLNDEPTQDISDGVSLMFTMGDMIHEMVVEWLEEHMEGWTVKEVEERAREGIEPLRGRLDILLENEETGATIVVDIKTKRGGSFRYLKADGAKRADKLQVQAYAKSRDADGGLLLYIDREGQNWILTFPVKRDDEAVDAARDDLLAIKTADPEDIPLVRASLTRSENKGPDSLKLELPWQVEWCSLKTCHCKEALPDNLPFGRVIGHVEDGKVTMKEDYAKWESEIQKRVDRGEV